MKVKIYPFKILSHLFVCLFIVCLFKYDNSKRLYSNTYQVDLQLVESVHGYGDPCSALFLFGATRLYVNRYTYRKIKKDEYINLSITAEASDVNKSDINEK